MGRKFSVPIPLLDLVAGLTRLLDFLRGKNRTNFRRLFMATVKGHRCWEMDRVRFRPKRGVEEPGEGEGYWMPAWTWPIIRDILRRDHLQKVAKGEETKIETAQREKDPGFEWGFTEQMDLAAFYSLMKESVTDMLYSHRKEGP